MRIHSGPGDSVSNKRPNIHTRLKSDYRNCLLDWRSPYTKQTLAAGRLATASQLLARNKNDLGIRLLSTAYFIVLDREEPGFDPFVDGKVLTKRLGAVNKIARSLGLKQLEDYAFQDLSDFGGPELELKWFDAIEGKKLGVGNSSTFTRESKRRKRCR